MTSKLIMLATLFIAACGAQPKPVEIAPKITADGSKPGVSGCAGCLVVVCSADMKSLDTVHLDLTLPSGDKLETAMLEITPAGARSAEAISISTSDLVLGKQSITKLNPAAISGLKAPLDWKKASARLTLYRKGSKGQVGTLIHLPVKVDTCK